MDREHELIWENYRTILEVTLSKANITRMMKQYSVDEATARDLIDRFNEIQPLMPADNKNRDIFAVSARGSVHDLEYVIKWWKQTKDMRTAKKDDIAKGAQVVFQNKDFTVYHITSPAAAVKYGKGTKWCISGNDQDTPMYFADYARRYGIYFVISPTGAASKLAVMTDEEGICGGYDAADDAEDKHRINEFLRSVDIDPTVFKPHERDWIAEMDQYIKDMYGCDYKNDIIGNIIDMLSGMYARECQHPLPNLVKLLLDDPIWQHNDHNRSWIACIYARDILHKRVLELEPIIERSKNAAAEYAINVVKDRWGPIEQILRRQQWHDSVMDRYERAFNFKFTHL